MLPALRRREVVVDLVETAAVDMEDTMEEAVGEGVAMEEEVVEVETVDTVEAEAVVATEDVVDMITAADITITTGMEETDTMGEAEAEVVAMEEAAVVAMGVVVGMITVGAMATEMVATKESCIFQQQQHTVTRR